MATHKARSFFREVARSLPYVMNTYKLTEVTTLNQLRSSIAEQFRHHGKVTDPKVVDMLIYQGRENLEQTLLQHRQRHHIITKYLSSPALNAEAARAKASGSFLDRFYVNTV